MTAVREELGRRLRRWRNTALPIVQAALAASVAWFVDEDDASDRA